MDPAVTGALIGAGGAGFIALATQWLGNRRESAARAHALRIEHDADARAALDEALATAYDVRAAIAAYARAVVLVADSLAIDSDVIPDSLYNDAKQKMAAVDDQIARVRYSWSRLTIRFGSEHDVTATYAGILLASHDLRDAATNMLFKGYHEDLTAETACARPSALDRLVSELSERAHDWASRSCFFAQPPIGVCTSVCRAGHSGPSLAPARRPPAWGKSDSRPRQARPAEGPAVARAGPSVD